MSSSDPRKTYIEAMTRAIKQTAGLNTGGALKDAIDQAVAGMGGSGMRKALDELARGTGGGLREALDQAAQGMNGGLRKSIENAAREARLDGGLRQLQQIAQPVGRDQIDKLLGSNHTIADQISQVFGTTSPLDVYRQAASEFAQRASAAATLESAPSSNRCEWPRVSPRRRPQISWDQTPPPNSPGRWLEIETRTRMSRCPRAISGSRWRWGERSTRGAVRPRAARRPGPHRRCYCWCWESRSTGRYLSGKCCSGSSWC